VVPDPPVPTGAAQRVHTVANAHDVWGRRSAAFGRRHHPLRPLAPGSDALVTPQSRAALVKDHALQLGFDTVGVADLSPVPHGDSLRDWLAQGMAGTMTYMERQAIRRLEPARILPGAHRAVVVTVNHFSQEPSPMPGYGRVAKYARGRDYHESLQEPLRQLAAFIRSLGDAGTVARWYVDAGPVPERELAQRAGLGWIGKNTMLIDPKRGSFCFLATVLTNLDLAPDPPFDADRCGSCRLCLDACPTQAFPDERLLDARLCISYLTIELKVDVPAEQAEKMGNWVFGCDICQDVCPWNRSFARPSTSVALELDPTIALLDLKSLEEIGDLEFTQQYGWTPLERTGAAGIRRNARIAAANFAREAPCQTC